MQIDISGFMCVEKAITLSLSGSNNVIDGPANELKNAIVKGKICIIFLKNLFKINDYRRTFTKQKSFFVDFKLSISC